MTSPEVCIPNIGAAGRRRRGALGWIALAATAVVAVAALVVDAPRSVRVLVAVPAFLGAVGVLQAREKT